MFQRIQSRSDQRLVKGRRLSRRAAVGAIALLSSLLAQPVQALTVSGEVVATVSVDGAEMLTVTKDGQYGIAVGGSTVTLVAIASGSLSVVGTWELTPEYYPDGSMDAELTGVAVSPDGAFILVGVKDNDDANLETFNEVPGRVVALSLPDLTVLGEVTVGRGPDSVAIASTGEFAAVANEDEENEEDLTNLSNRPGSISIIDLRNGPSRLTQVEVPIPPDNIPFFAHDPQPETVRISPDARFIVATLQENNAIARLEVPATLPATLTPDLFSVTNFDAGVRTGMGLVQGGAGEEGCLSSAYDPAQMQEFFSAREPDGIAITPDGQFLVTADEDNLTNANAQQVAGVPLSAHGSRSISMYDAATGTFLGDSGNSIEASVVGLGLPQRCESKGPEPEVVSVGVMGDRTLAFVALERSDAVSIHDITDPSNIQLLDTVVLNPNGVGMDTSAELEPEGIEFIPATSQVIVSNPEAGLLSLINVILLD